MSAGIALAGNGQLLYNLPDFRSGQIAAARRPCAAVPNEKPEEQLWQNYTFVMGRWVHLKRRMR